MNGQGKDQVSQADPARQDGLGKFQVNDLRKGLKTRFKPGCSMGFSNKTIYVLAWMTAMPYIPGDISNHFWANPQITASMVTMILKYRYGQLWNMKIAFRRQRPYLPGSTTIRQLPSLRSSGLRWSHPWRMQAAGLQGNVHRSP